MWRGGEVEREGEREGGGGRGREREREGTGLNWRDRQSLATGRRYVRSRGAAGTSAWRSITSLWRVAPTWDSPSIHTHIYKA